MREIKYEMVQFLNDKLMNNAIAKMAIETKNPRLLFIEAVKACYGIREKSNRNDGPMVELIQETIGSHNNEAWCMAFMQTCLAYCEEVTGIISPLAASEHCLTTWAKSPIEQRVKYRPLAGAIVIWQHGKSSNGHTGMVLDCDGKIFHSIEGNTTGGNSPEGEVVRDGGGVYYNTRSMKGNGAMRVKGYLKPF